MVAAGIVLLAVLVGGGVTLALTGNKTNTNSQGPGGGASQGTGNGNNTQGTGNQASSGPSASGPSTAASSAAPVTPADELCTAAIKANPRWVCLTGAVDDGTKITISYDAGWAGGTPNVNGGFHLHIYGGDGTTPPDRIMGTQAGGGAGAWYVEDKNPSVKPASSGEYKSIIGVGTRPKVCARIANGSHQLVADNTGKGTYVTGNCIPITRASG
jgi:hypothetical protein